jgi:hypothetical protein
VRIVCEVQKVFEIKTMSSSNNSSSHTVKGPGGGGQPGDSADHVPVPPADALSKLSKVEVIEETKDPMLFGLIPSPDSKTSTASKLGPAPSSSMGSDIDVSDVKASSPTPMRRAVSDPGSGASGMNMDGSDSDAPEHTQSQQQQLQPRHSFSEQPSSSSSSAGGTAYSIVPSRPAPNPRSFSFNSSLQQPKYNNNSRNPYHVGRYPHQHSFSRSQALSTQEKTSSKSPVSSSSSSRENFYGGYNAHARNGSPYVALGGVGDVFQRVHEVITGVVDNVVPQHQHTPLQQQQTSTQQQSNIVAGKHDLESGLMHHGAFLGDPATPEVAKLQTGDGDYATGEDPDIIETFYCKVCFENIRMSDSFCASECTTFKHTYCLPCMSAYASIQVPRPTIHVLY